MAATLTATKVSTVAGNVRLRIIRMIPSTANDSLDSGFGRTAFVKVTPVGNTDVDIGHARNSTTNVDNGTLTIGTNFFTGAPSAGLATMLVQRG